MLINVWTNDMLLTESVRTTLSGVKGIIRTNAFLPVWRISFVPIYMSKCISYPCEAGGGFILIQRRISSQDAFRVSKSFSKVCNEGST